MKGLNKLYAGFAVSVLLFFALGYWIVKPQAPNQPPYLSFSADRDGTKAWRELLEQKQPAVKEWRLGWNYLPAGSGMLLVAIGPEAVTKADREKVLEWVEQGNDFVLVDRQPQGWQDVETLRIDGKADTAAAKSGGPDSGAAAVRALTAAPEYAQGGGLSGEVSTPYRIKPGGGMTALFSDDAGALAGRMQVGAGSMTVVLTPEWLFNGKILEHSHFELMWPLFGKSWNAVWVDETHHGYGTNPGLLAVYPAWLVLASAQLGLALLLWLWLRGKRFGPVHTPRAWTVRRGDEGLQAVAAWYERLGYRDEALRHQQRFLRLLLARRWGLSPGADTRQAEAAARARLPEAQAARLVRLLEDESRANQSPGRNAKAFVERTREMGEMIACLEKE